MRITVFGSARLPEESSEYQEAMRLGRILAARGDTIVSGGYGGLMEAVSRGAREANGAVVGVTMAVWAGRLTPNRYLSEEHAAKTLFARIESLVESDCLIAMTGGAGTLGEVALAWNLSQMDLMPSKPVILLGPMWRDLVEAFRKSLIVGETDLALLTVVDTIEAAVGALDAFRQQANSGLWQG